MKAEINIASFVPLVLSGHSSMGKNSSMIKVEVPIFPIVPWNKKPMQADITAHYSVVLHTRGHMWYNNSFHHQQENVMTKFIDVEQLSGYDLDFATATVLELSPYRIKGNDQVMVPLDQRSSIGYFPQMNPTALINTRRIKIEWNGNICFATMHGQVATGREVGEAVCRAVVKALTMELK